MDEAAGKDATAPAATGAGSAGTADDGGRTPPAKEGRGSAPAPDTAAPTTASITKVFHPGVTFTPHQKSYVDKGGILQPRRCERRLREQWKTPGRVKAPVRRAALTRRDIVPQPSRLARATREQ